MGDPALRLRRMLALLPRILTQKPEASAIGALLRTQAGALAQVDDDLMRLMHDHWIGLAAGEPPAAGEPAPLERLGELLDVRRMPLRDMTETAGDDVAAREDNEAYRRRLVRTAHALTRGATTPRALLSLAIAAFGAAPCVRTVRDRDTTLAWGMPHAVRRRCPVCRDAAPGPCTNRAQALFRAELTDCPPTPARHRQPAAQVGSPFTVVSDSLVADRPVIRMTARSYQQTYCALQNRDTGELMLYAGILHAGEQLTVEPALDTSERVVFDSFEDTETHPWLASFPQGRAFVSTEDSPLQPLGDRRSRPVSEKIFYVSGFGFDDPRSRFAAPEDSEGAEFGRLGIERRTPQLRPGRNEWAVLTFARPDSEFDDEDSRFADDGAVCGTRFALFDGTAGDTRASQAEMLFAAFSTTASPVDPDGKATGEAPSPPVYDIELEWTVRPPVTFRLRLPRNAAVRVAEQLGAIEVLRRQVLHARAAGVRALFDFPTPPLIEPHPVGERLSLAARVHSRERVTVFDRSPRLSAALRLQDRRSPGDGSVLLSARMLTDRARAGLGADAGPGARLRWEEAVMARERPALLSVGGVRLADSHPVTDGAIAFGQIFDRSRFDEASFGLEFAGDNWTMND